MSAAQAAVVEHDVRCLQALVPNASPFNLQTTSLDITASGVFVREAFPPDVRAADEPMLIDVRSSQALLAERLDVGASGHVDLPPGGCVVAETAERLALDDAYCAMYQSVSVLNQVFVGPVGSVWVQPGYEGPLRIALRNHNRVHAYRLHAGQVIGQLVFFRL